MPNKIYEKPQKLAVINDLSGYGRCSLTVALPIISALGVQACPVPTAILSNHTAFPSEYRYDFTEHMQPYVEKWEELGFFFDGILCGYMNQEQQVNTAASFIEKTRTPQTVVFVDPAMADHGKLYRGFTPEYAGLIKDRLIRNATVIKPNITEACFLTGFPYEVLQADAGLHTMRKLKADLYNILSGLQKLGPENIVITGIERGDRIINAICCEEEISFLSIRKSGKNRPGTGDIFSAITCASLMKKMTLKKSAVKAADFISTAIRISDEAKIPEKEGVIFECILSKLSATADSL